MDLYDRIESTRFLGEEFLTWLWFRSTRNDGLFELPDDSRIELHFDNQLTLEATLAEAERSRLTGGSPGFSPEAREALRSGKRVTQAKLRLFKEGREWMMTLSAPTLAIGGLKIPAVLGKQEDDRFYERMDLLDEADACMRALYLMFLQCRMEESSWTAELEKMQHWLEEEE